MKQIESICRNGLIIVLVLGLFSEYDLYAQIKKKDTESDLSKRIESLEKTVKSQQKKIESLEKEVGLLKFEKPLFKIRSDSLMRINPDKGTPFNFNGRTYYMMPLGGGSKSRTDSAGIKK